MQMSMDDYNLFKINKPIRIIELFGGYGSQSIALKRLNANFEHWKLCEWAIKSIQAYKDLHMPNDNNDYSKELTTKEIKDYLYNKGISNNYNEPMSESQINRLTEEDARKIYNNIISTNNLVNIQQVKGKDLEILDKDKYIYICTYSFPCQDLSMAGNKKGMSDTNTRSGMLWEVERILKECKERNELPQILLMENVPQVHNKKNIGDFKKWISSLEEMGYTNYWQDLIATDYGIPQTRNRTFMVSLLEGSYKFPKPIPLETKLKDLLEEKVDEKYFLSDKMKEYIYKESTGNYDRLKARISVDKQIEKGIACTLTTRADSRPIDNFIKVKNTTNCINGEEHGVVVNLKRELCNKLIKENLVEEGDVIKHSYTSQILDGNKKCVEKSDGNMITLTTRADCNGIAVNDEELRIRKLTPKECGRLMGLHDDEIEKIMEHQSDASGYHLFGDSIVVNVLTAIFGEML